MANTTNIIPNKLTMYQRVEGGVWHHIALPVNPDTVHEFHLN